MNEREAKALVSDAGRMLLNEGLVARTWGNVSCRTGNNSFVITPSGLGYEGMTADDIVSYSMADGTYVGTRKPSSEKGVHAAAYASFADANFVIHTHQTYASALGVAGFERLALSADEETALGGVALAFYGLPGTKRLTKNVEKALASGAHCILMAHHGALIAGRDRAEAFERAKLLESVCQRATLGQPAETTADGAALEALAAAVKSDFPFIGTTNDAAVCAASKYAPLHAELDDMAQMIGPKLAAVGNSAEAVREALIKHDAVFVENLGAIVRAKTLGDAEALKTLVEKASIVALHARASGKSARLSAVDANLMRFIYLKKYAKKIGR